LTHI